jgi:ribosome-interacting GTPase 1
MRKAKESEKTRGYLGNKMAKLKDEIVQETRELRGTRKLTWIKG